MLLDQQKNTDKVATSTGGKAERVALSRITVKQEMAQLEEASKADQPAPAATTPPAPTTPASTAAPAKTPSSGSVLELENPDHTQAAAARAAIVDPWEEDLNSGFEGSSLVDISQVHEGSFQKEKRASERVKRALRKKDGLMNKDLKNKDD